MGRLIPGSLRRIVTAIAVPDRQSTSLASSMAVATNPASPMAAGPPASRFTAVPGYGVLRAMHDVGPLQHFRGVVLPLPGVPYNPPTQLPAAGTGTTSTLAWMSMGVRPGM